MIKRNYFGSLTIKTETCTAKCSQINVIKIIPRKNLRNAGLYILTVREIFRISRAVTASSTFVHRIQHFVNNVRNQRV
jgi:hypothetical protein